MSSSNSSSATSTKTRDGRVAGDNGAIGVSSEGDVLVNIVPDEAFALGELTIEAMREVAESAGEGAVDAIYQVRQIAQDSNEQVGETARDSLEIYDGLATEAITTIADLAQNATGKFAGALATTQEKNRSESTQLGEQLIKIGLPAMAVAFAVSQIWGSK